MFGRLSAWAHRRRIGLGFIILAVGMMIALAATNTLHNQNERLARAADRTAEQAKRIAEQNRQLVIAVHNERSERLISACQASNLAAKRAVVGEYKRIALLLERIAPLPRAAFVQKAVSQAIAADVRAVSEANPIRDCSARALGIKPLPLEITSPGATPAQGSRSPPKGTVAGTTARPRLTTTTTRPGRRRRPHPPHP